MAVPVHWGGQLRGVLSVAYRRRIRTTQQHLDALEAFAELAAVAFQNASVQAGPRTRGTHRSADRLPQPCRAARGPRARDRACGAHPGTSARAGADRPRPLQGGQRRARSPRRRRGAAPRRPRARRARRARTTSPRATAATSSRWSRSTPNEEQAREIAGRAIERITRRARRPRRDRRRRARPPASSSGPPASSARDLIARADRALIYGKRAGRRGEVLTLADLPATFLPGSAERRDRAAAAGGCARTRQEWRPRAEDDADARLRKRTRQLALANQLGARLAAMTDLDAIHNAVVEELHEAFGFFLCAVVRIREDGFVESVAGRGDAFVRLGLANWRQPMRARPDRPLPAHPPAGPRRRRPRRAGATTTTPETTDVRSELVVPLLVDGELYGVINVEEVRPRRVRRGRRAAAADRRRPGGRRDALGRPLPAARARLPRHRGGARRRARGQGRLHGRPRALDRRRRPRRSGGGSGSDEQELRDLRLGAVFHDIGKIAVPESILDKPGPAHARGARGDGAPHGGRASRSSRRSSSSRASASSCATSTSAGTAAATPTASPARRSRSASRIILACDALHAMTSDRPYRARAARGRRARRAAPPRRHAVRPAGGGRAARRGRRPHARARNVTVSR